MEAPQHSPPATSCGSRSTLPDRVRALSGLSAPRRGGADRAGGVHRALARPFRGVPHAPADAPGAGDLGGLPHAVRVARLPRFGRRASDRQPDRQGRASASRWHQQAARGRNVPQVRQQVQDHPQAGKRSTEAPQPAREHREGAFIGHGRGVLRSDEARHASWRWGSFSCATDRSSQTASTGSAAPIRRSGCVGSAPTSTDRCPGTSPETSALA